MNLVSGYGNRIVRNTEKSNPVELMDRVLPEIIKEVVTDCFDCILSVRHAVASVREYLRQIRCLLRERISKGLYNGSKKYRSDRSKRKKGSRL